MVKNLKRELRGQDLQVAGGTAFQVEGTAYANALR